MWARPELITIFGAWYAFLLYWIVPYCTWHIAIQYARLICEHSAVESEEEEYAITRTTIPRTFLEFDLHSCRAMSAITSSTIGILASRFIACPSCTGS